LHCLADNHPLLPHLPLFQTNLAALEGPGAKSLIKQWAEAVLKRLTAYASWPVTSTRLDDLLDVYLAREQRDRCKLAYTLTIDTTTKAVTQVTTASQGGSGSCPAPLMVPVTAAVTGTGISDGPLAGAGVATKVLPVVAGSSAGATATGLTW
jgi:hypothetical protein